jgi:hypothetical protein
MRYRVGGHEGGAEETAVGLRRCGADGGGHFGAQKVPKGGGWGGCVEGVFSTLHRTCDTLFIYFIYIIYIYYIYIYIYIYIGG